MVIKAYKEKQCTMPENKQGGQNSLPEVAGELALEM